MRILLPLLARAGALWDESGCHLLAARRWTRQIAYLEKTPQIRDVLLFRRRSAGAGAKLAGRITHTPARHPAHRDCAHRLARTGLHAHANHGRELCQMLAQFPSAVAQHPRQTIPTRITAELAQACDRLLRAGIPLGQPIRPVAGINDCVNIQQQAGGRIWCASACALLPLHLRPGGRRRAFPHAGFQRHRDHRGFARSYLRLCRAHLRGGCPRRRSARFRSMPNYDLSSSRPQGGLRNTKVSSAPTKNRRIYQFPRPKHMRLLQPPRAGGACQIGRVLGLLEGKQMSIKPQGFDHCTCAAKRRIACVLDDKKWKPLGIGGG